MTDDRPPQPQNPGPEPAGATSAEPPPMTAFAWRNGLVRPTQGRFLAGVCGALARATNTDPILWRVILAVLTIFGGFGVLLYLIGWLLLPADGDTASPVEALLGRGESATSSTLTIIAGVVALISVGAFVSEPFRPGIFGAVLLGAAALVLLRDQRGRSRSAGPAGPASAPMASAPAAPGPMATGPTATAAATGSTTAWPGEVPPSEEGPHAAPSAPFGPPTPYPAAPPYATEPAYSAPYAPPSPFGQAPYAPPSPFGPPAPGAAKAPFAPRGPFAPGGLPPQPPPPAGFHQSPWGGHGRATPPPRVKPPRSRLGRLTLSLLLIVIGVMIGIDLGVRRIPTNAYLVAALAIVALGLIIGAWFGRARGLIALGIVLAIALTSVAGVSQLDRGWRGGTVTFAPTAVSQLESSYGQDVGDVRLDLSNVDFATELGTVDLTARVDVGSITIILPPNVDVVVDANVDVGNADVLGQNWNGLGLDSRTVEDKGADGVGGGTLHLTARVDLGNLEVRR